MWSCACCQGCQGCCCPPLAQLLLHVHNCPVRAHLLLYVARSRRVCCQGRCCCSVQLLLVLQRGRWVEWQLQGCGGQLMKAVPGCPWRMAR
eukprot:scaffold253653_cov18-Tisochrysis_lutea.AAC.1